VRYFWGPAEAQLRQGRVQPPLRVRFTSLSMKNGAPALTGGGSINAPCAAFGMSIIAHELGTPATALS
jgi:hypothetical protein